MSSMISTPATTPRPASDIAASEGTPPLSPASPRRHPELGKTFATRKIEVATLAIRATATQNTMFSVARAARSRRQRRESRAMAEADRLLDSTRAVLAQPKSRQKSVTFSSGPPQVHEIETLTPESTSQLTEDTEDTTTDEDELERDESDQSSNESALIDSPAPRSSDLADLSDLTSETADGATPSVSSYSHKMASERKGQRISRDHVLSKLEERKQRAQDRLRDASETPSSDASVPLPNAVFIESQIAGMLKRAEEAKTSAFSHGAYGAPPYAMTDGLHDHANTLEVIAEKVPASSFAVDALSPAQSVSARKVQAWRDSLDSEDSDATTLTASSLDDTAAATSSATDAPQAKPSQVTAEGRMSDFSRTLLHEFARITGDASLRYRQLHTPRLVLASTSDFSSDHTKQDIQERPIIPDRISSAAWVPKTSAWKTVDSVKEPESRPTTPSDAMQGASGTEGTHGRLYIRVIAAENLDFPIDKDSPSIRCVLNDGQQEHYSAVEHMAHTVRFGHEFQIDHVDLDCEFTLTLHVTEPDPPAMGHLRRLLGKPVRPRSCLSRYTNVADGAIAQSRVAFKSIEPQCRTQLCTASFALINGWYRQRSSLLPSIPKKERLSVQEKAIGKLTVQLFFLPNVEAHMEGIPKDIHACEQLQHMARFHRTCWHKGYMSQLGGDVKFWRRRFFRLQGGCLFSYSDTFHTPRTIIDLSKIKLLASDRQRILIDTTHSSHRKPSQNRLLSDLDEICHQDDNGDSPPSPPQTSDDDDFSFSVKNGFQLVFDNGEKIEFFCDTADERDRWLEILRAMAGRIPACPPWMGNPHENA